MELVRLSEHVWACEQRERGLGWSNSALVALRRYLEDVQAAARAAWADGLTVLDACLGIDLGPYATWDDPHRLPATVHRVYRECEGLAWDAPHDRGAVMADVRAFKAILAARA